MLPQFRHGDDSLRDCARRLSATLTSATWIGLVVSVVRPQQREEEGVTVHLPEHFLGAAWPPFAAGLTHWPDVVVIGSPRPDNAIAELLVHLPADARLFLADLDMVDATLAAEILLASDRNLEAYQRGGIETFIAAERERAAARIRAEYRDHDAGFERFRTRMLTPG